MEAITTPKIAELWSTIIADREFHSPKGKFRWAVGQPLGCLSSFPSFAGWHHDYVQYLGTIKGFKAFDEYQILGDDIVIWNPDVARLYYKNIQSLGIPINLAKSLLGSKELNQVEFVRRQSLKGEEISGLNNNLVSKDKVKHVAELLDNMFHRNMVQQTPVCFFGFRPNESHRIGLISKLIQIRLAILRKEDINIQFGDNTLLIEYKTILEKLRETRTTKLMKKLGLLDTILSGKTLGELFKRSHVPITNEQLGETGYSNPELLHPLVWVINHRGEELTNALDNIWADDADVLQPIEYLPLPQRAIYFPKGQKPDSEYLSTACIDIYDILLTDLKSKFPET
jgi:hypothetical protein